MRETIVRTADPTRIPLSERVPRLTIQVAAWTTLLRITNQTRR